MCSKYFVSKVERPKVVDSIILFLDNAIFNIKKRNVTDIAILISEPVASLVIREIRAPYIRVSNDGMSHLFSFKEYKGIPVYPHYKIDEVVVYDATGLVNDAVYKFKLELIKHEPEKKQKNS